MIPYFGIFVCSAYICTHYSVLPTVLHIFFPSPYAHIILYFVLPVCTHYFFPPMHTLFCSAYCTRTHISIVHFPPIYAHITILLFIFCLLYCMPTSFFRLYTRAKLVSVKKKKNLILSSLSDHNESKTTTFHYYSGTLMRKSPRALNCSSPPQARLVASSHNTPPSSDVALCISLAARLTLSPWCTSPTFNRVRLFNNLNDETRIRIQKKKIRERS